jgi:hypothetical protein
MSAYDYMPGIPAAGHITGGGFWHPGGKGNCVKCELGPALRVPGSREQTDAEAHDWNRQVRHHLRTLDDGWDGSHIRVQRGTDGVLVAWSVTTLAWNTALAGLGDDPGEGHSESGFAANH